MKSKQLFFITAVLLFAITSCKTKDEKTIPPQKIKVVEVKNQDIPLYSFYVGQIFGEKDIPIRARVEGFLESINFKEGGKVKKGQLLYTIDSQPFVAEVNAQKSYLAEAQTRLAKAQADLSRIKPLAEAKAVSQSDLDAAQAQYDAALAGLEAAKANVKSAEINLSYTQIKSPINGNIGITNAKVGEFVGREPNPVILNVVSKTDNVLVKFFITEKEYLLFARHRQTNKEENTGRAENLELILSDGSIYKYKGTLNAIDAKVDPNTGSILIQAVFPNPEGLLKPGMYSKVKVEYMTAKDAIVVPSRCLTELQGQYFVYVVTDSNTVETRQVQTGYKAGEMTIIKTGLKSGEKIVFDGLQKVTTDAAIVPEVVEFKSQNQ
jgi:membrane fusion protein (multidrug efflux system)